MPRTHNLHVLGANNCSARHQWQRQMLFRDYFRIYAGDAREYESLKRGLATRFTQDMRSYEEHKTEFILATLEKARAWRRVEH